MISSPSTPATIAAGSLLLLCLVLGGGHLALAQKEGNAKTMVSTKAPLECMCRPCTGIEDANVIPQELAAFADDGTLTSYFQKGQLRNSE
ncbi:hypothetical protein pipiens_015069 [Culex pipiens pipiens]|uniref:Bursicon n=1 Tax=Culex pipiens pipiens TaxID=38569 RepID=A0ABD1CS76_CULPP